MRTQPSDVHVHAVNEFTDERGWSESEIVPTTAWLNWNIYQPARYIITDFNDANGHQDAEKGQNAASEGSTFNGGEGFITNGSFTITNFEEHFEDGHPEEFTSVTTDLACEYRSSERKIDGVSTQSMISTTLTVFDTSGKEVISFDDCAGATIEMSVGDYHYTYEVVASGPLALSLIHI